jgi:hypothetical protein
VPLSHIYWFHRERELPPPASAMTTFSILCTNSRNGGQTELVIEAPTLAAAEQHVLSTRPHFIIKRTDPIVRKFVCIGWNVRQDRYDELSYITSSADAARARCQELNPDFAIDRVEQAL